MFPSVRDAFLDFTSVIEGFVPFMYPDIKNLITTGAGNLIDLSQSGNPEPWTPALGLPWQRPDGTPASPDEIKEAWLTVKNAGASQWSTSKKATLTTIRLPDESIVDLVGRKLDEFEQELTGRIPGFASLPADAQLALLSMAWAMGAGFKYPKLIAAINQSPPDFVTAAQQSHIPDANNSGLIPRNEANADLFMHAADVIKNSLPLDELQFDLTSFLSKWGGKARRVFASAGQTIAQNPKSSTGILLAVLSVALGGWYFYSHRKGLLS